ncbi:MAG: sugar ABC transporter permease [Actinobacteria bacterium]|nr:sugar ABC transporter permease [Actinomycetota bacterium]
MSLRLRLMLPLVVVFSASVGYPLLHAFYLSLTNYKITSRGDTKIVWLQQYIATLQDPNYWSSLRVTAVFVILAVFIEFWLGLFVALALQKQRKIKDLTRSFLLAPMFVTPIAIGLMFRFILNQQLGVIPTFLAKFGLAYDFFGPGKALFTIVLIDVWQWTPFMVLLLLAGLEGLSKSPFEAAKIDGASALFTFRKITLPMLMPVISVAILIRSLDAMKIFEYVFAITRGGPAIETMTIQYYTYQTGIQFYRLGLASAMSYLMLIIVMIIAVILFRRVEATRKNQ